jgi:hypothetical protein
MVMKLVSVCQSVFVIAPSPYSEVGMCAQATLACTRCDRQASGRGSRDRQADPARALQRQDSDRD